MAEQLTQGAVLEAQLENKYDTPQPIALYFDIIEEHSISLQSQITDNWLENNSVINDHIANSPITISLRGLSGELVYEQGSWVQKINNSIVNKIGANTADKLSVIPALLPPVDNITQLAKNAINYVESSYKKYEKIFNRFRNSIDKQAKLEKIFLDLQGIREEKTPVTVQTPFSSFDNMYLQSITLRQGNVDHIADIEITLKQLNFTTTSTTTANEKNRSMFNFIQREETEDHGYVQGLTPSGSDGDSISKFRGL